MLFELDLTRCWRAGAGLAARARQQRCCATWRWWCRSVQHDALMAMLRADPSGLVRAATLFDVYKPQAPGRAWPGERSLAVRLELLDFDSHADRRAHRCRRGRGRGAGGAAFGARLRADPGAEHPWQPMTPRDRVILPSLETPTLTKAELAELLFDRWA
jgi:hypothetical protein